MGDTAASTKPTIVLIPGSFIHSSHYIPTLQPLKDAGLSIHVLDPPCYYSKKSNLPTMSDDAAFIAAFVEKLADAGEEVVLVSHSYGGTPASECMKGLSVEERKKQGKKGGVARLAYITAVVPKVGGGLADTLVGGEQIPFEADAVSPGSLSCHVAVESVSSDLVPKSLSLGVLMGSHRMAGCSTHSPKSHSMCA